MFVQHGSGIHYLLNLFELYFWLRSFHPKWSSTRNFSLLNTSSNIISNLKHPAYQKLVKLRKNARPLLPVTHQKDKGSGTVKTGFFRNIPRSFYWPWLDLWLSKSRIRSTPSRTGRQTMRASKKINSTVQEMGIFIPVTALPGIPR